MRHYHKFLLSLLAALTAAMPLQAVVFEQRGDVNGDGQVNISDVTRLVNYLGGNGSLLNEETADTNADGIVNISDVVMLINHILNGGELPPIEPQPKSFTVNEVTFLMVPVEGGTFMMGGTEEQGNDPINREKPVHQVTLSSYYIGQTEVTQALWTAVMGDNPAYFPSAQQPVEQVSWDDCQLFIATLNGLTGMSFRLPTEAEWEFAARGGNESMGFKYSGSNDLSVVGWYSGNDAWQVRGTAPYGPHAVATRNPNELMLFDMSGNVHEWCQDWFGQYSADEQSDPSGPTSGNTRVYRGGSWYFDEWFSRVSFRNGAVPTYRSYGIGLRLAL